MLTLSIRQPWAWLIVQGFKSIENRDWQTKVRGKFLVHASKGMTKAEYEDCLDLCKAISRTHPFPAGTILPSFDRLERGGIVGMTEILDCVAESDSLWFSGKFGFVLGKARTLPFMELKGRLGFFQAEYDKKLLEAA